MTKQKPKKIVVISAETLERMKKGPYLNKLDIVYNLALSEVKSAGVEVDAEKMKICISEYIEKERRDNKGMPYFSLEGLIQVILSLLGGGKI